MILVQVGQPNHWKHKHSPTDTDGYHEYFKFSSDFIFSSALLQHILFFNIQILYISEPSQKVIGESLVQQKVNMMLTWWRIFGLLYISHIFIVRTGWNKLYIWIYIKCILYVLISEKAACDSVVTGITWSALLTALEWKLKS